ncbi:MAG: dihydrofolate reductase [Methylococcales bacterium]|nr:dihydrofolate reductase [Methylococcales bacterium]
MKITLIVAMAENRVIGHKQTMPWHLSADLKKFKQITLGKPILMGRKTHESIGRALPERENIIISRNPHYQATGCEVFNHIDEALKYLSNQTEIFVIGGAGFYQSMLPFATTLYLTEIHKAFSGDTYFPEIPLDEWQESARDTITNDPKVDFNYSFVTFKRTSSPCLEEKTDEI